MSPENPFILVVKSRSNVKVTRHTKQCPSVFLHSVSAGLFYFAIVNPAAHKLVCDMYKTSIYRVSAKHSYTQHDTAITFLYVCLSVTRWCRIKTTEPIITQLKLQTW